MQIPFHLTGKTVLVTGASSGIGRAVAIACAQMGAQVILNARNVERLEQTRMAMEGDNHQICPADLSTVASIEALVEQLPNLDGVVCCAGVVNTIVFRQTDEEDLQRIFTTNTFSVIRLLRTLLENKKLKKEASIVCISSISGVYCGYMGGGLYGASKAALQGLMKALALEVAPRKIRVNTINPGMIATPLLEQTDFTAEQLEEDAKRYPLQRYGTPEEVASAAVYLLSDATRWMTGTSLLLDGGYTLQ